ncbi:hypothetical protein SDC9_24999 [bioreactor metagenome]|uniref:O-antigen ligase n=1 Tax=bioreactor metagenome TaxID=1076179 RepID=A0A644UJL6_9ZZZZ
MPGNKNYIVIFILFVIYYSQGSFYQTGSILSQISLFLILSISFYYFIKLQFVKNNKNSFNRAWTILLLINIIGFIFTADFNNLNHVSMLKNTLGCMLPFYPFYYFSIKNQLNPSYYISFFLIILPITIFQYYNNQITVYNNSISSDINLVNNVAYSFVSLMPYILFFKNKKLIPVILLGLIMAFIIQGAKRGAIISGISILFLYFYFQFKIIDKKNKIKGYLTAIIVILLLSSFAYYKFINNDFLVNRMIAITEGDSSGRDYIYKTIFTHWYKESNLANYIFGYGYASSLKITNGLFAHNDWLELLSNFGLIGIISYLYLFYIAIRYCFNKEWNLDKRILMITITISWFIITLVSMWYTTLNGYTQAIILAYLVGSKNKSIR